MLNQARLNFPRSPWNKAALLFSAIALMTACGSGGGAGTNSEPALPDDPTDEPIAPVINPAPESPQKETLPETVTPVVESDEVRVLANYDHVDPSHMINDGLLKKALLYYDQNKNNIANKRYLAVIDFAKKSTLKRFFIIDMTTGSVWGIHVAHGKGSDSNHDGYAERFSNVSGSNASSLGFYRGAETYNGSHGLSLRLDGLSSTNSNARSRAIVIHAADYVQESSVIQGRSWGCPAVAPENRSEVIKRLKGGAIIYAGLGQ